MGHCARMKSEWVMSPRVSRALRRPIFWFGRSCGGAIGAEAEEAAFEDDAAGPVAVFVVDGVSSSTRAPAIARAFAPPTDRASWACSSRYLASILDMSASLGESCRDENAPQLPVQVSPGSLECSHGSTSLRV